MESNFKFGVNLGSPHQVEGSSPLSDYTNLELRRGTPTLDQGWWDNPDQFSRDIELAKKLGVSVVRLGTEWARVSILGDTFDKSALRHYRQMFDEVRSAGLEPMLNLHHFTLPVDIAMAGG